MANLYQIVDWEQNFEGAKSKTYNNKSQCMMPTKHGLGFKKLIKSGRNGVALFGAWCALIQVCSRHPKPRQGYCTDTGGIAGNPYTSEDLEMMTCIPSKTFDELFQVAVNPEVAWLRILQGYHEDTAVSPQYPLHLDLNLNSDLNSDSTANAVYEFPENLKVPEFEKAWSDWESFRKELKHKLTASTRKRQLAMLSKFGPTIAIQMIEQSITNGWQGLFELKPHGGQQFTPAPTETEIDYDANTQDASDWKPGDQG